MFIIRFSGGIGNQLFQYNFLCYLREKFPNADIRVDSKSFYKYDDPHCGFNLKISEKNAPYGYDLKFKTITDDTYEENFGETENIVFKGYWQDRRFLAKKYFELNDVCDFIPENEQLLGKIKKAGNNSIFIHVRRGDYCNNHIFCGVASKSYYQNAINDFCLINRNAVFFVFSNDIEWAKNNLIFNGYETIFVTGVDNNKSSVVSDLFYMSKCKNAIISNSSYSWWAQFLITNSKKKCYSPNYWLNEDIDNNDCGIIDIQKRNDITMIPNIPFADEKKKDPLLSFCVYVQNCEYRIKNIISSIFNQNIENFEVIIIDDFSTDKTPELLDEYARINNNITIIHNNEYIGYFNSLKLFNKIGHGKYIWIINENTYLEENVLLSITNDLQKTNQTCTVNINYKGPDNQKELLSKYIFLKEDFNIIIANIKDYPKISELWYTDFSFKNYLKIHSIKYNAINVITINELSRKNDCKKIVKLFYNKNEISNSEIDYTFNQFWRILNSSQKKGLLLVICEQFLPLWICRLIIKILRRR